MDFLFSGAVSRLEYPYLALALDIPFFKNAVGTCLKRSLPVACVILQPALSCWLWPREALASCICTAGKVRLMVLMCMLSVWSFPVRLRLRTSLRVRFPAQLCVRPCLRAYTAIACACPCKGVSQPFLLLFGQGRVDQGRVATSIFGWRKATAPANVCPLVHLFDLPNLLT